MAQDRTQIHYRVDTLLKYYGIKDEEKLLKYLKTIGHDTESETQII
jgi:hypothetical protein